MRRSKFVYIGAFAAIVLGYLLALYTLPPDASTLTKYSLSPAQARALSLTVAIPIVLIWSLGLFGFLRFTAYASSIKKDRDGAAFLTIGKGLGILVFGLPLQALMNSVINHITRTNPELIPRGVIVLNYLLIAIMFGSFYLMYKGARDLIYNVKTTSHSKHYYFWNIVFAVLSINFIYFTLSNPARQVPVEGVARAVYYLPDWLIVNTIILPYLIAWYLGILSVYYLRHYRNKVSGVLYKHALTYISNGIAAVVLASMLQRFLGSLTVFLNSQSLRMLLLILYLLLIAISLGYILIAIGANKLRKIEEV